MGSRASQDMGINNTMISIDGLNNKQIALLNFIWSCSGEDQFLSWFASLTTMDQKTVESLLQLLNYEVMDHEFLDESFTDAKEVLSKFTWRH